MTNRNGFFLLLTTTIVAACAGVVSEPPERALERRAPVGPGARSKMRRLSLPRGAAEPQQSFLFAALHVPPRLQSLSEELRRVQAPHVAVALQRRRVGRSTRAVP